MGPFRQGLLELGYVEGQNIVIECRGTPRATDRLPGFAAELVLLNVDVLVAVGTASAQAARHATNTIPIVMVSVGDPVGSGLVTSLARPGGNVTGLSVLALDMVPRALEFLKEAAPSVSRVAVWLDLTNPGQTSADQQFDAAATRFGVTAERIDVRTAASLDAAFSAALRQRAEALFVHPLPIALRDVQRIAQFAIGNRLPTMALFPQFVREGMLMSRQGPGLDDPAVAARAGGPGHRVMDRRRFLVTRWQQPTKFDLVINLKTAKGLDLTIPPSSLARADQVIE